MGNFQENWDIPKINKNTRISALGGNIKIRLDRTKWLVLKAIVFSVYNSRSVIQNTPGMTPQ